MPDDKPNHAGYCHCPILQFASEAQKLATFGIEISNSGTLSTVIGVVRDKHGCRGPNKDMQCPWWTVALALSPQSMAFFYGAKRLPQLLPKEDGDSPDGVYL